MGGIGRYLGIYVYKHVSVGVRSRIQLMGVFYFNLVFNLSICKMQFPPIYNA